MTERKEFVPLVTETSAKTKDCKLQENKQSDLPRLPPEIKEWGENVLRVTLEEIHSRKT